MNAYAQLVQDHPPKVIRTEDENRFWLDKLADLNARWEKLTPAETELYDTLVILVEDYERRVYPFEAASELEVIRELLEANGLRQKDLTPDVFETESVASAVLSGKRSLTLDHVKRLCARFNLPASVFVKSATSTAD